MSTERKNAGPIGVFDSGAGGISVLKRLTGELPGEDFLYYGDSANAPYGTKTVPEVTACARRVTEALLARGAKAIVVACNTATAAAIGTLRSEYPDLPIIGMEPALKPAVERSDAARPRVLILATPVTLREEKFAHLCEKYQDRGEIVPVPCPGLADFVERGELDSDELRAYLRARLEPFLAPVPDAAVLGCTHYPFVLPLIREILGKDVPVYDGIPGTSRELHRKLDESGLRSGKTEGGSVRFLNSEESEEKNRQFEALYQSAISATED